MPKEQYQELLSRYLQDIQLSGKLSRLAYQKGQQLYEMGHCHLLLSTQNQYRYLVSGDYQDFQAQIDFQDQKIMHSCSCLSLNICSHVYASGLQTQQELSRSKQVDREGVIKYSREGMIKRVLEEREERAAKEKYQLDFADNIHGEHHLTNIEGKVYELSFYDFSKKLGYCSCPDYQTNKLETCKHLMYAFKEFDLKFKGIQLPSQSYPFLELFRHPLFDYQISWFYPHVPEDGIQKILDEYFDENQLYKEDKKDDLHLFVEQIQVFKSVKIRPEVKNYIASFFEAKALKELFLGKTFRADLLNLPIFPYQQDGIIFASARRGSILADEIGMGKSVQAIGAALYKMSVLGYEKIKILCPDHLLEHWNYELKKWVPNPLWASFEIESFQNISTHQATDFLIIDEAQKIDDYDSQLLNQIHKIPFKHILLITDSKLVNSLIKFYAMTGLFDPYLLTPLWELSYKHCLFDASNPEKIVGYYNLEQLPNRLKDVYLRREKAEISIQFPETNSILIPVALDDHLKLEQSEISQKVIDIAKKSKPTNYDMMQFKVLCRQLLKLSQYSVSVKGPSSLTPKLIEFRHFTKHKLNLLKDEHVLVFAQEKSVQYQIKRILEEERKSVQILEPEQSQFAEDIQYFITSDQLQENLPLAHHIIYFHIPTNPSIINERCKMLEESQAGIQQNRVYIFRTSNSLEWVFHVWSDKKPYFLNQLKDYLLETDKKDQLSLRLKEELIHELKTLVIPRVDSISSTNEIQMDLFGEVESVKMAKKKTGALVSQNESLQSFFNSIIQSFSIFENLDENLKAELKNGNIQISEKSGEILIRIKPKEV